nr:MAG: ORF1 [TTV-like mini virus]
MPPYKRYWNYYQPKWRRRRRRFPYRRRRPTKAFRNRKRRRTVRRFKLKKFKRKLKQIRLKQWQPCTIKKCHIKGFLCLFEGGNGRQNNNYTLFKESYVPPHEPGGGGWSIQKLSLGILYAQNNDLMNYWTKSNARLNLCRYLYCNVTLYRDPFTDYIFHYFHDAPNNVTKYYYASFHPAKLIFLKHKVVVPSLNTYPLKKKPYIKLRIQPPKLFKNQWFFQQHMSNIPLIHFAAVATDLTNMFGSKSSENNNCTVPTLNTIFFTHPCFQYRTSQTPKYGYTPNSSNYLWGLQNASIPFKNNKWNQAIYLGNAMLNETGWPPSSKPTTPTAPYAPPNNWGNPFHFSYLTGSAPTFITTATQDPTYQVSQWDKPIPETLERKTDSIIYLRYNPYKDKGKGNKVYFIPTYMAQHNTWEPTSDTDLLLQDFPLWIMLWGFEDIVKKMGKCPNLDYDWVLVINSKYISGTEPYIVPLSEDFINGQGPYDREREQISGQDSSHWYPCFRYQRQVVNDICKTAPFVNRCDYVTNLQAHIKYDFSFKWGGNPSPMESVYDPNSQPITPSPDYQLLLNEIIDPNTSIQNYLYPWDSRRDFITQKAAERIKQSESYDIPMFTDGEQTSTDIALFQKAPQTKETSETQEKALLQQLHNIQQFNQQLLNRFQHLKSSLMDL